LLPAEREDMPQLAGLPDAAPTDLPLMEKPNQMPMPEPSRAYWGPALV